MKRRLLPLLSALALLAPGGRVSAAAPPAADAEKIYDIPAGDAISSLGAFAAQSGEELVYAADAVEGIKTNPVQGSYRPAEALRTMLAGTGLVISQDERSGALAVGNQTSPGAGARRIAPPIVPEMIPRPPTAPAPLGFLSQANEDAILLTPFEVLSDPDNSYGALQSNSLSVFAMDLQKMPATAEVFTQAFIDDTNSQTIEEDMLDQLFGDRRLRPRRRRRVHGIERRPRRRRRTQHPRFRFHGDQGRRLFRAAFVHPQRQRHHSHLHDRAGRSGRRAAIAPLRSDRRRWSDQRRLQTRRIRDHPGIRPLWHQRFGRKDRDDRRQCRQ